MYARFTVGPIGRENRDKSLSMSKDMIDGIFCLCSACWYDKVNVTSQCLSMKR